MISNCNKFVQQMVLPRAMTKLKAPQHSAESRADRTPLENAHGFQDLHKVWITYFLE